MNNDWKETLHFSQRERRGIFIFVAIIGTFLCIPPLFEKYYLPPTVDFSSFKLAIAEYEANQLSATNSSNIDLPLPAPFNPNTASLEELLSVGLVAPVAQRIIKYRNAGGVFYRKEDLKKIYGLEDKQYHEIQEYIHIPSANKVKKNTHPQFKMNVTQARSLSYEKKIPIEKELQPFNFDPNYVTFQELNSMELPTKVAQQLIKYRNKGGSFKRKEDVKKIYSLSERQYQQLAPFIKFKQSSVSSTIPLSYNKTPSKNSSQNIQIDINKASIEEWQQLKGIGPYYAKKIVSFREKLGGFATIVQVGTTYELPDSVFQKISTQLLVSALTNTLSINTISVEELKAHPYIKKYQAIAIVNYRKNHGPFDSVEKFKRVKVFSGKDLERIIPYLSFE